MEIVLELDVNAPPERCFDLSRSVDVHVRSAASTEERVVAGVMSGLMNLGDTVTWEARHFGVVQRLTSKITLFERPHHFRDSQVKGAFASFDHDHFFTAVGAGTIMREVFSFRAPLGPLGTLAERLFLARYMRRFLLERAKVIQALAESPDWSKYV